MFKNILDAGFQNGLVPVMILMGVSAAMGLLAAFVYLKTEKRTESGMAASLIVLPPVVTAVLSAVNGNLGAGIAIMGVFALTRFRSRRASFKEMTYILFDMTIGVVSASGYIFFAVFLTLFVCLLFYVLKRTGFGEGSSREKNVRIEIPENIDYSGLFDEVFQKYTERFELVSARTANLGSMYELSYDVRLKPDVREKDLLDDIRIRNGNLRVSVARRDLEILD